MKRSTVAFVTLDVASIIDTAGRPALAVGIPPIGHYWDLFVRETDRDAVESTLATEGFVRLDRRWLRLTDDRAEVVELLDEALWQLADREVEALFEEAAPLADYSHVLVPSPAHRLLILARRLPRIPAFLEPKHRERIRVTLADQPGAFESARERADAWGVSRRLAQLEARSRREPLPGWPPGRLRLPVRGAVVAISGLDGVGKGTQTEALRRSLAALGYDTTVVWAPIGQNPGVRRFAATTKRALSRLPFGPFAGAGTEAADGHAFSRTEPGTPAFGPGRRLAAGAWSTVETLATAISFRRAALGSRLRGRIVIYDRYVLDTIVDLRFWYAPDGEMRAQETLVRALAPKPGRAYLLDLAAEIAHQRKPDWSLEQTRLRAELYRRAHADLDVQRLDAAQPVTELARTILTDVLCTLRR